MEPKPQTPTTASEPQIGRDAHWRVIGLRSSQPLHFQHAPQHRRWSVPDAGASKEAALQICAGIR